MTRSISSEIVYNLGAARNIGSALTRFGISETCDAVLFVVVEPTKDKLTTLYDAVQGDIVDDVAAGLASGMDLGSLRTVYDLTDREVSSGLLEDSIVTRVAVRDVK